MASKIIKQGTSRDSSIQRFSFSENFEETQPFMEQPHWSDLSPGAIGSPKKAPSPAQPSDPSPDTGQLEKAAYEDGFRQGEIAGMEIAERKAEAAMKRYAESIIEIGKLKPALYAQVEREVVKLAVEVAKKIVHREIQVDRDIIQTLVRVALTHVAEKSAVTIHLSPADYNYLLEHRAELAQSEGRDISLLADQSIEQGGCLIETECGDIDARVEEKFREVEHIFFEDLK
jgi:flagellar assembly protein FliH